MCLMVQYIITFFTKETPQFRVLFPGLLSGFWTSLPIFPKVCRNFLNTVFLTELRTLFSIILFLWSLRH